MNIAEMALEALMTSKLVDLIKAKAVNGGKSSHEDEVRTVGMPMRWLNRK